MVNGESTRETEGNWMEGQRQLSSWRTKTSVTSVRRTRVLAVASVPTVANLVINVTPITVLVTSWKLTMLVSVSIQTK